MAPEKFFTRYLSRTRNLATKIGRIFNGLSLSSACRIRLQAMTRHMIWNQNPFFETVYGIYKKRYMEFFSIRFVL